jgi:pimeloyl-ACP methyl ester carboxylesterase
MRRVSSGGLELAVETRGAGPPLLFAHGLSGNRERTLLALEPLAGDYRIVVFDQRGHGDSTPVREPALYDPEAMAADAAAVLDSLDVDRAIIGGESMGAATALLFAARWPERVERLLLVAPAFGRMLNPDHVRLAELGGEIDRVGMERFLANSGERLRSGYRAAPEVVAAVRRMHLSHEPASLAAAFRAVSRWTFDHDLSRLSARRPAAAVLAWSGDVMHPIALAREVAASLPGAVFEELPGWMEVFADPAIIGRTLARILARKGEG